MSHRQELNLGAEKIVLSADGAESWTGWASVGFMAAGFISSIVGVVMISDSAERGLGETLLVAAGVPVFYTAGLVFGIVWLVDKDEVETERYNLGTSSLEPPQPPPLRVGLSSTRDGGVVTLDLSW